ncbi:unnamed protein product [Scytosiphon promiscuus]
MSDSNNGNEKKNRDADARLWLQSLFPALMRYHDYLHGSRGDPETGLVYVLHPWETEVSADSALWSSLLTETRAQAANESWTPPPIPPSVASVAGFPGEEAFDAALFLSDCCARNDRVDSEVKRDCPFLLQDVQFNAALVRSDKALLELAGILEATRSGWQGKARQHEAFFVYTPEQYERLKKRAERAELGTAMAHLWSPADGAFLSRYTSTTMNETFLVRPATSSSFSALLSPGLTPFRANAAVDVLLSPGDLSFRCGNHPVTGEECGDGGPVDARSLHRLNSRSSSSSSSSDRENEAADSGGRRVWVLHNFLAERGFRRQSLTGLSVWVANSTLSLLAPSLPAGHHGEFVDDYEEGDGTDDDGSDDDDDEFLLRFHRGFDGTTGLPLPGAEGNRSSLAAAVSVLLLLGDVPDGGNDFPPITHATLFVLVAIELAFSFAMGVCCLVFSVNLVRKLREEDQLPPYRHRRLSSQSGSGGGRGGGGGSGSSGSGSGGYFTGAGVGVVRTKAGGGERYRDQGESVSGSGARSSTRRRSSRRVSTDAAAAAAAATEFARRRGIGSLLSRKAGSRLDRYYYGGGGGVDDDGDGYGGSESDDDDYVETAVAMTTTAESVANGGRIGAGTPSIGEEQQQQQQQQRQWRRRRRWRRRRKHGPAGPILPRSPRRERRRRRAHGDVAGDSPPPSAGESDGHSGVHSNGETKTIAKRRRRRRRRDGKGRKERARRRGRRRRGFGGAADRQRRRGRGQER